MIIETIATLRHNNLPASAATTVASTVATLSAVWYSVTCRELSPV